MKQRETECCTPNGQIKRYKDCIGCDKKPLELNQNKMKANELRIGNYVSDIHAVGTFYAEVKKLDFSRCYYGKFNSDYSDLKPIPLTEEWLFKFGFEWSIRHQAWHKLSFIFDLSERGVGGYYMHIVKKNNDIICPEIIYVHQLQNLYFALTGEELTFKSE